MFEQRRLADAGLASEHEHATLPTPHARKQGIDDRTLATAAPQLGVDQLVDRQGPMLAAGSAAVNRAAAGALPRDPSGEEPKERAARRKGSRDPDEAMYADGEQRIGRSVEGLLGEARVRQPTPCCGCEIRSASGPGPDDDGAGRAELR